MPRRVALAFPLLLLILTSVAHAAPDDAELGTQARAILERYCHGCHGQGGSSKGGFDYVLRRDKPSRVEIDGRAMTVSDHGDAAPLRYAGAATTLGLLIGRTVREAIAGRLPR